MKKKSDKPFYTLYEYVILKYVFLFSALFSSVPFSISIFLKFLYTHFYLLLSQAVDGRESTAGVEPARPRS